MGAWDSLSIREKAEMMKAAIRNGITTLPEIKQAYNEFAEGGNIYDGTKPHSSQMQKKYIYDVLPGLFAQDGVKISVTSGYRPGAVVRGTNKPSRHGLKQAADIVGDFDAIRRVLDDPNSNTSKWLLANGYGYLDETSKTGTTKFWHDKKRDHSHYHIGTDKGIVASYAKKMQKLLSELPQQQETVSMLPTAVTVPEFIPYNPQVFFGQQVATMQMPIESVDVPQEETATNQEPTEENNNFGTFNTIMELLNAATPQESVPVMAQAQAKASSPYIVNRFDKGGSKKSGGSFYQTHRARWFNFLRKKGVDPVKAERLATYFSAQDSLESGHGTSDAARRKNNYGGMQRLDKKTNKMVNVSYGSIDDYMNAKWKMMNSKYSRALNAKSVQEYANILNDPKYHGKAYMYGLYKGYRDGQPLDVARQTKYMNDYTRIMMDIAGEKGFKGADVPDDLSIVQPENPYTQFIPFEPFNPQVFNSPQAFVAPTREQFEAEQPIVEAAKDYAYSPEQLEKEERRQGLNNLSFILGMMNGGNGSSFADTIGMLTGNIAAKGGPIHIKPENRGKFTALKERTGHSATWFKEHGTPAQKKMATFALNARHWKHGLGGNLYEEGGPEKKWKALDNIDFVAIPDTSFTRDKTGVGSIEYFDSRYPEGITYPNGYHREHPLPGKDVILYNPNDNDKQDIRLDALHIMPKDATYDTLYSQYLDEIYTGQAGDLAWKGVKKWEDDAKKYGKNNIDTKNQYIRNEADGLLRNSLIEGDSDYRKQKGYSASKSDAVKEFPTLVPYVDAIQNYLVTGERPANILPEVTIIGKKRRGKKHGYGGDLYFDGGPKYKKSKSPYYDPKTDTVYAPDSVGEFYQHEYFHARPDNEFLKGISQYYENLNDDKLTQMGADLPFVKRFENDPGHFYSPEEIGARVAASRYMLKQAGVKNIDNSFLDNARKNEMMYGENFRDLLHMYNNDNLIGIFKGNYANGGHIYDGTSEDTQQMDIPYAGELPDVLIEGKKRNNVLRQVTEHWVTNDKGEEVPTYWGYNPTSKQYEQLYKLTGDTDMENSVFSTYDNRHTFNIPKATEMRKAHEQWVKNGGNASDFDKVILGTLGLGLTPIALPEIAAGVSTALANPYVDAGLTSYFAAHGLNHAINEGIDGWGDAAMTALEVAPLGRLAKPVYEELVQPGMRLFNSPLTGNWTKIGNREYRLSPNNLGANGSPIESRATPSWVEKLPLDESRYYRQVRPDALDSYRANGVISQFNKYGINPTRYEVPMFTKGKPSLYRGETKKYGDVWVVSKPEANLEWESVKGAAVSPKYNGEFNSAPVSEFEFYQYDPAKGYIKLDEGLNLPNGINFSRTPHIDYLKELSEQQQIEYLTQNGLNDQWLWALKNNPDHLENALSKAPIPNTPQITAENAASITPEQWTAAQDAADDAYYLLKQPASSERFQINKGVYDEEIPEEVKQIYRNAVLPRMLRAHSDYYPLQELYKEGVEKALSKGYTVYPQEVFDSAGKRAAGAAGLTFSDGHIAVREGYEDFALGHELRHRLQLSSSPSMQELKLLNDAYDANFENLGREYPHLKDINLSMERETLNYDARRSLVGDDVLKEFDLDTQNAIIDDMSDTDVFEAVEDADAYGSAFIDFLRKNNLLTHKKAQQFREAMKHASSVATPIAVGLTAAGIASKTSDKK